MKEWDNWFNSFNSAKGLLYAPWYQAIRDWKDGKRKAPLPPIEASLDPIQMCQLKCSHCNASAYLENPPKDKMIRMPDNVMMNLVDFLADWGVKAVCFGGGGCPTLHTKIWDSLLLAKERGMESSIATNGINYNDETIDIAVSTCRWIGVSVDSATKETYLKGRGVDCFDKTTENISKMAKRAKQLNTKCDVAFKFLLFEYNQHEIYEACKLAKELGAKDFHCRPADLTHQGMHKKYKGKATPYDIEKIEEQFKKCHELESEDFHVYTIVHKFLPGFIPNKNFSQCFASSCCIQLCPSGEVFLCPDQRYNDKYKLGDWYPDPKQILDFWGSKEHYDLVFKTGKSMCNTRCTFNPYCKQCEELFISDKDPMCWKFI